MDEKLLLVKRVDKWALGLTALFSLAGWMVGGGAVGVGVAAGGVVAMLNFKWLLFFLRIVFAADRRWAKVLTHLGVVVRYLALTVIVVLLIKSHHVNPLAVVVGLSIVSVAVVVAGLLHGLQSIRAAGQTG